MKMKTNFVGYSVPAHLRQLGLLMAFASFCSPASAAVISIANPSFEAVSVSQGNYVSGNPDGWSAFSNASSYGVINPAPSNLSGQNGNNVAFLNVGLTATFTSMQQSISYTVQAGDIIVLSFLIGKSNSALPAGEGPFPGYANYDAVLADSGGTPWVASSQTSPTLISNEMVLWTRTYTFDEGDLRIGQTLNLRAYVSGFVPSTGGQVMFDNFSLQTIPEPNALLLLGVGIVGLAKWRVSRKSV